MAVPERWQQLIFSWIVFFVFAGASYSAPPVLFPLIAAEMQLTQGQVAALPSVFLLSKACLSLPAGMCLQRWGVRRCMLVASVGLLLTAVVYVFAGTATQLAFLHVCFGVCYCLGGLAPQVLLCNSWFVEEKATAIGVLVTGFSMAGVFWPPLVGLVADARGWRAAYAMVPVSVALVGLPLVVFAIKDGPHGSASARQLHSRSCSRSVPDCRGEMEGLDETVEASHELGPLKTSKVPDSEQLAHSQDACCTTIGVRIESVGPRKPTAHISSPESRMCLRRMPWWMCSRSVWHLACMSVFTLYVINSLINTLGMYLKIDAGFSSTLCGVYSSIVFGMSVVGKLLYGLGSDSVTFGRSFAFGACALFTIGSAMVLHADVVSWGHINVTPAVGHVQLVSFAVIYGLGYGGCFTLVQSKAAQLFGDRAGFCELQSFLAVCQYFGSFVGVLATGKLRDWTGSYTVSFSIYPVVAVLVTIHCFFVMRAETPR